MPIPFQGGVGRKSTELKLSYELRKRLHVVTFTFTLLEEGNKAHSSDGNHILAAFKEPEKYESVKAALEDISAEVEQLTSIQVDDIDFQIKYRLGGDWKFLAMVTGIDAASSDHACIWCKCKTSERFDTETKRQKSFEIECSNCSSHGHNWLTCKDRCQHCGMACYSSHNKRIPSCQKEN